MALKLYILDPADSPTEVDIPSNGIRAFKLGVYDDRPSTLTFTVAAPQMDLAPVGLAHGTRIVFFDDSGAGQSLSTPLFEGDITDVDPGKGGYEVNITAIDPSGSNAITCFNREWEDGTTPGERARPRVVYNPIPNDDDWSYCNGEQYTVGEIIADLLDVNLAPLVEQRRAPNTGTAYETADLTALTVIPQDKIVLQSMGVRAAIELVLKQSYWSKILRWEPGTRKWRIVDIDSLPDVTITLNKDKDSGVPVPHPCLNGTFNRTTEGRCTAVRIRGPEGKQRLDLFMSLGDLTDISDGPLIQSGAFGDVYGKNAWQITDEDIRRILRNLDSVAFAPRGRSQFGSPCNPNTGLFDPTYKLQDIETSYSATVSPVFMVRYPDNNMGSDQWQAVEGMRIDFKEGIIRCGQDADGNSMFIHRYNPCPPTISSILQANWENPEDVRFYYCTPDVPLEVRFPETGYAGTAYDLAGVERTLDIYQEQLAVYQADGVNYTTPERLAAYAAIAEEVHKSKCDIIMSGSLTLEGTDYTWKALNGRLNIAAEDGQGNVVTTDLEAIRARVSEVEYDFSEGLTVLTYNSGWLEESGVNVDMLRDRLKLQALTPYFNLTSMSNDFVEYSRKSSMTGRTIKLWTPMYNYNFQGGFVNSKGQVEGIVHRSVRTRAAGMKWDDLGRTSEQ